jgi:hypothetical protein
MDLAFLAVIAETRIFDTFESYSNMAELDALNGGFNWGGAYVARTNEFGIVSYDTFEDYSAGEDINDLNQGFSWNGAFYVGNEGYTGVKSVDTFEDYSAAADLDGLNNAGDPSYTGDQDRAWGGAYVARTL